MADNKMIDDKHGGEEKETTADEQKDYTAIDEFIASLDPDELEYLKSKLEGSDSTIEEPSMDDYHAAMKGDE